MAHELDTRDNGNTSFVSLRQPAWHQLGTIAQDELSYEEAMNLGGLDYPLQLCALMAQEPILDAEGNARDWLETRVPNHFAVVRGDRREVFGVVGDRYSIVTNREATAIVEALVGEGLAVIETAGALRGGRDAFMALRFTGERLDAAGFNGGDEVKFYGLVRTNHTGQVSVQIATTPIRVVCANTLAMALENGRSAIHSVRHTRNAGERLVAAAHDAWAELAGDAESMARAFLQLRSRQLSEAQFEQAVLDVIAPLPTEPKSDASTRAKALWTTAMQSAGETRQLVAGLWSFGVGQTGEPTAWHAFNAATEAIDHFGVMSAVRGAAKAEALVAQLPGGSIANAKAKVWNNLLALTV